MEYSSFQVTVNCQGKLRSLLLNSDYVNGIKTGLDRIGTERL